MRSIVLGKGDKERLVYFDAKTKLHLKKYLNARTDENPALFVSIRHPHNRLLSSGVELIPNAKGFSSTNLKYMRRFYQLYSIRPQVVDELSISSVDENHPQVADQLADALDPGIFMIPWGHHRIILDNINADAKKALFYIRETIENNWSRAVLQNWLGIRACG